MAKETMLCPFLGTPCRECAFYRGRHYYLCFNKKYRGHIDNPASRHMSWERSDGIEAHKRRPDGKFEMPKVLIAPYDPFTSPLKDID